jgi:hypothetical protein
MRGSAAVASPAKVTFTNIFHTFVKTERSLDLPILGAMVGVSTYLKASILALCCFMRIHEACIVATFSDLDKAQKVKTRLTEGGISAEVRDESKLQKYWFLSNPLAADKVVVAEKDYEKARSVLRAADVQEHILCGEIRCPECDSANIEYPQFTRRFVSTTWVEIFCFLHILEKRFYCRRCQHTWPTSVALRYETDVLNWPQKNGRLVKKETI